MAVYAEAVIKVLQDLIHPDTGKDIVEMAIVQNVVSTEEKISLDLVFQRPNDPFTGSIRKAVLRAIQGKFGDSIPVEIEIIAPQHKPVTASPTNPLPGVKNIIAIASGKGGVGKSTIASNLAVAVAATGAKVGLLDADIYGPSMPKMFNVEELRPVFDKRNGKDVIIPIEKYGVKMLSIGFFVNPDDAAIWRGPMATSAIKQLINEADWGELDYLFLDLPPGTGDIHLTLVQEIEITGAIIVSTPQPVALADAVKGISMFRSDKINVPVLGLVENMSWFTPAELPENKYYIFGKDGCAKLAASMNVPLLAQIPLVQSIREGGDAGEPAVMSDNEQISTAFKALANEVLKQVAIRNATLDPTKKVEITRR